MEGDWRKESVGKAEKLLFHIFHFSFSSLLPKGQTFGYSLLYWVHIAV